MKKRHLYYLPALAFIALAIFQFNATNALFGAGIFIFVALCNVLAALNKLNYALVVLGFSLLLFLITSSFPPIEKWGLHTKEGREILGLIVSCNWVAMLGIFKLYNDTYK